MKYALQNRFMFRDEADVVICGAGTAGAVAAVAAAREGAKVILIEQFGMPGGTATLGLVTPLMHSGVTGCPLSSAISKEINEKMIAIGASYGEGRAFDPLKLAFIYEELLDLPNIRLYYHTTLTDVALSDEGGKLEGIVVTNKEGRGFITGKVYIDATGDADLCAFSGAEMMHGDDEKGVNQPVSLRYLVSGIDIVRFYEYMRSVDAARHEAEGEEYGPLQYPEPVYVPGKQTFHSAVTNRHRRWTLVPVFEEGIRQGELTYEDLIYWQVFDVPGRTETLAFNNPEFFDIPDIMTSSGMTRTQVEGRKAIDRQINFYRKHFPGFENAYVSSISAMVGIRESRRAVTDYVLTAQDVSAHRKFDDHICGNNYGVDVHGRKSLVLNHAGEKAVSELPWYDIPYRSLLVKAFSNLMVTGRCVGADFIAQSSLRVQIPCRAMGEAAGIGAAMASKANVSPKEIDGAKVRAVMKANGAEFPEDVYRA